MAERSDLSLFSRDIDIQDTKNSSPKKEDKKLKKEKKIKKEKKVKEKNKEDKMNQQDQELLKNLTINDNTKPLTPIPVANSTPSQPPVTTVVPKIVTEHSTSPYTSPPNNTTMVRRPSIGERVILAEDTGGPPEIDPKEIQYNETKDFLGAGSFGKVYVGRCRGKRVAVKVPLKQDLSDKELEDFRHEVIIMKKIFHPNVVSLLGTCSIIGQLKIITELMHTDMEKLLKSNRPLTLYQKMKMAKDAALGINWIHGITNLIHRDLKPANLLVDENLTVKITDFGFSQLKEHNLMESNGVARGTPLWMAPEVMQGKKFNEKCDVYSYGIILWQIITRKEPYENHTDFRKFRAAVCTGGERPQIPSDTLPILTDLITRCWQNDYTQRPSFKEIIHSLDEIIVEIVIDSNSEARDYWIRNFMTPKQELQETVSWNDFLQRLQLELIYSNQSTTSPKPEFHPDTFKNLKILLAEKTLDEKFVVTMSRFNIVVSWFGCFFKPSSQSFAVLDEIRKIVGKDWFHGDISKDEAERRLAHRPAGTFLIRLSSTTPQFPFTISMIDSQHRRIQYEPGGEYQFKGSSVSYKSLVDLVEANKDTTLALDLRFPCPKNVINPAWGYT